MTSSALFLALLLLAVLASNANAVREDVGVSVRAEAWDASTTPLTVLVTGASGRTGSIVYKLLKALPPTAVSLRGLVHNATKARAVLGCGACDPAEGIYEADVTDASTLGAAFESVDALVILSASVPQPGPDGNFFYPPHGYPIDVDFHGGVNQIMAAVQAGVKQVVLVSSMGTTEPDSFLDKLGDGHALFYKLNAEAAVMSSGLSFTIIKPGGLTDGPPCVSELVVGHNDGHLSGKDVLVSRGDVADVVVAALQYPDLSANTRFDLTSIPGVPPKTGDLKQVFVDAKNLAL